MDRSFVELNDSNSNGQKQQQQSFLSLRVGIVIASLARFPHLLTLLHSTHMDTRYVRTMKSGNESCRTGWLVSKMGRRIIFHYVFAEVISRKIKIYSRALYL